MRVFVVFALSCLFVAVPAAAQDKSITVFAAASMKNALDDVNAAFSKAAGVKVVASYAASSALARQIEQGAPADIFVSADVDWMNYSAAKKNIRDHTRVNLLRNRLVLIAPKDAKIDKLTIWASVEKRFAMADNVRAALALVARGEAVLGIVYETDARIEPGVKIVGAFPPDSHPPIVYPVAATMNARPEAAAYLNFLHSRVAKAVFEHSGFTFLVQPTS